MSKKTEKRSRLMAYLEKLYSGAQLYSMDAISDVYPIWFDTKILASTNGGQAACSCLTMGYEIRYYNPAPFSIVLVVINNFKDIHILANEEKVAKRFFDRVFLSPKLDQTIDDFNIFEGYSNDSDHQLFVSGLVNDLLRGHIAPNIRWDELKGDSSNVEAAVNNANEERENEAAIVLPWADTNIGDKLH